MRMKWREKEGEREREGKQREKERNKWRGSEGRSCLFLDDQANTL